MYIYIHYIYIYICTHIYITWFVCWGVWRHVKFVVITL